jgi:hypothetical protein
VITFEYLRDAYFATQEITAVPGLAEEPCRCVKNTVKASVDLSIVGRERKRVDM